MVCCVFSGDSNWPSNGPKRPTLTGNKFYTIGTTSGIPSENHPFPSNCLLPPQSVSAASSASRVHQYLHRLSICKLKKLSSKFNFMNVCYRGVVDPLLRSIGTGMAREHRPPPHRVFGAFERWKLLISENCSMKAFWYSITTESVSARRTHSFVVGKVSA